MTFVVSPTESKVIIVVIVVKIKGVLRRKDDGDCPEVAVPSEHIQYILSPTYQFPLLS